MKYILIGQADTKRTTFFQQAANECRTKVEFLELFHQECQNISNAFVKIDPPQYTTSSILELEVIVNQYLDFISTLGRLSMVSNVSFLNTPEAIRQTLDKVRCKKVLMEHKIPTTQMIGFGLKSYDELRECMNQSKMVQVFIKPVLGSGAVGVCAYRLNKHSGKEQLYTSMRLKQGHLFNTKKVVSISDHHQIESLLQAFMKIPVIVEQWIPKESYQGKSFDLRVLYQFGKIDYIVARLSDTPITNLHLNNQALAVEQLALSDYLIENISNLCNKAMPLFPGLSSAGFDILLTKDNRQPMIIEINGQGDLLYQDIYENNSIYKTQIKMRKKYNEYTRGASEGMDGR